MLHRLPCMRCGMSCRSAIEGNRRALCHRLFTRAAGCMMWKGKAHGGDETQSEKAVIVNVESLLDLQAAGSHVVLTLKVELCLGRAPSAFGLPFQAIHRGIRSSVPYHLAHLSATAPRFLLSRPTSVPRAHTHAIHTYILPHCSCLDYCPVSPRLRAAAAVPRS